MGASALADYRTSGWATSEIASHGALVSSRRLETLAERNWRIN